MKVTFLALLGMSIINVSTAGIAEESLDAQCTGSNKLHCCNQIQSGESAAKEICASYNCGLDIQCDDDSNSDVSRILNDGDSWHRWYKPSNSWSKPSGGWNSKVSKSLCFIVSELVAFYDLTYCVHLSHHNHVLRSHQANGPAGTANLVGGTANQVDGASPAVGASQVVAGIAGRR